MSTKSYTSLRITGIPGTWDEASVVTSFVDALVIGSPPKPNPSIVAIRPVMDPDKGLCIGEVIVDFTSEAMARQCKSQIDSHAIKIKGAGIISARLISTQSKVLPLEDYDIFVQGLSPSLTESTLLEFAKLLNQDVKSVRILYNKYGYSLGVGFLMYKSELSAKNAYSVYEESLELGSQPLSLKLIDKNELNLCESGDTTMLYVGNIASDVTKIQLKSIFEEFGDLASLAYTVGKRRSFLKYARRESAVAALISMNHKEIFGARLMVSWSRLPGFQTYEDELDAAVEYFEFDQPEYDDDDTNLIPTAIPQPKKEDHKTQMQERLDGLMKCIEDD